MFPLVCDSNYGNIVTKVAGKVGQPIYAIRVVTVPPIAVALTPNSVVNRGLRKNPSGSKKRETVEQVGTVAVKVRVGPPTFVVVVRLVVTVP